MKGTTHFAAGTLAGMSTALMLGLDMGEALPVIACSGIASMVPDIDVGTSKMGRLVGPGSFLIQLFIGHRTFFHAPLPYAAALTALWIWQPSWWLYLTAAGIGILSHLILDSFNPAGVPMLWPSAKRLHLGNHTSGGIVDRLLGIALILANIWLFSNYADFTG